MITGKFHWIENMFTHQALGLATESNEPNKVILITPALSTVTGNPCWPHLFFSCFDSYGNRSLFSFQGDINKNDY